MSRPESRKFLRGDVSQPLDPMTGAPITGFVTVDDLAWCVFQADPGVREVIVRDCDPAVGHVTVEIAGGDVQRVADDLDDRRALNLAVHVRSAR